MASLPNPKYTRLLKYPPWATNDWREREREGLWEMKGDYAYQNDKQVPLLRNLEFKRLTLLANQIWCRCMKGVTDRSPNQYRWLPKSPNLAHRSTSFASQPPSSNASNGCHEYQTCRFWRVCLTCCSAQQGRRYLERNGEDLVETLVFAMRKATQNTEKRKCRVETCYWWHRHWALTDTFGCNRKRLIWQLRECTWKKTMEVN